jgi:hypothetical protein
MVSILAVRQGGLNMTSEEKRALFDTVQIGDFLGWRKVPETAEFGDASLLTQLGGQICHIEIVIRKIIENGIVTDLEVITANGKIVAKELTSHKLKDDTDIYIVGVRGITMNERMRMIGLATAEADLGVIYNWDIIKVMARKTFLTGLWFVGFFINKYTWTTPPWGNKEMPGTVCSKSCAKYIRSIKPDFMKKYWIDYITPSAIFNADETFTDRP